MWRLHPTLTLEEGDNAPPEDHQALIWVAVRRELRACSHYWHRSRIPDDVAKMACPNLLVPRRALSGIWFLYKIPVCLRDACVIVQRLKDGCCPSIIELDYYW